MAPRGYTLLVALAVGALVPGCRGKEGPEEPVWGKQPCAHCAMVVSDRSYAAQLEAPDGERVHFDDLGCMIVYVDERGVTPRHLWVRAEARDAWVDATTARYRAGARTPMDYGFGAEEGGSITFEQVRSAVLARKGTAR